MSTEGDRPEEALTSSERELRLLVEAIPALVWRAGPEGNIEYVNKRMLDYLGAPLGEVIGWGWMDKVHPHDVAFKVRTWLQNLEFGSPHDALCRFRGADSRYRWFEVRGEPLRASDGSVFSWHGVLIDIDDRKKAEEAIRESEFKLRQIIETVPGLLWSVGPDGEPTHINQRMLDYSGMRFEEFKHRGWEAFVHPADFPETAKAFYHAIQTGTSYQGVMRLRRADGEFRWHHARCEPLRDQEGRIIQWYGLCVDTDEAQLQAILNVIPAYTWYAAPSGALTFVNKRIADYLGLPKDHPLRFGIDVGAQYDAHIPFLHPDDQEGARKAWPENMRTGEASEFSFRVRNAEGGYRWFLSRVEPLRASDGTLLLWVGVNLDIEELKCAEQALRESEAKFRDYAESASDWLWEIGPDYKITLLTENAFGSNAADRIGTAYWDRALDLETEPEKWRRVRATLDARKPFRDFVYCSMGGNGSPMYVKASGKPVFDANGEFRGYRGTGADVTATVRAEEALRQMRLQLEHANRLATMGQLTASIAHEVNQPIAASVTNAQAALRWLDSLKPDLEEARQALGRIVRDGHRAGAVVGRIRDLVKKAPPRKDLVEINSAIREIIEVTRNEALKNGVSVHTELAEDLPVIHGDRVELQQVLLNLIINAVEAMRDMSEGTRDVLIMSAKAEADEVLVSVRDSGPGLAPAIRDSLFKAFQTTKPSGLGLGLSICRSIIELHGGRLWASANAPRGAIFQFTLPPRPLRQNLRKIRHAHAPAVISPATSGLDPSADRVLSRKPS